MDLDYLKLNYNMYIHFLKFFFPKIHHNNIFQFEYFQKLLKYLFKKINHESKLYLALGTEVSSPL